MLTGATGFIGARLRLGLAHDWRLIATGRHAGDPGTVAIDLTNPSSLGRVIDAVAPATVVHTAAIADPDLCEREPELAARVNVEAVKTLAGLCSKAKVRLLHFSTDLVFDGAKAWYGEDDAIRPLSTYGRTKAHSEEAVLSLCPGSVVLRVSNCYGRRLGAKTCFLDHLQASLAAGQQVPGFIDQWRTPTAGDQLPEVVHSLLMRPDIRGVFHWGGADRATRYQAAQTFCRVMGYDARLVRPTRTAERSFLAPRPRDTSLDSSRLAAVLGLKPLGLEDGYRAVRFSN